MARMSIHHSKATFAAVSVVLLSACSTSAPPQSSATPESSPRASEHEVERSVLGSPTTLAAIEAVLDEPGPLEVETILSAHWSSPRSGLINLEHPRAKDLSDGPEPLEIYVPALSHPTAGLVLVETGVDRALVDEQHPFRNSQVGQAFGFAALDVQSPVGDWLGERAVAGVLLTHLHLDHVLGLPDLPLNVPLYVGPGETTLESAYHELTQPEDDARLEGRAALREWNLEGAEALDVFGDQALFVLGSPGHTPGSVALLARGTRGAVLFTGDTCHTAWGWENDVEPGTFSHDREANAASLAALRQLAARHPAMEVRLGHQSLGAPAE